MISHITADFRKQYQRLPFHIQQQAQEAYRVWKIDPYHSSLFFKQVSQTYPLYSVRIGQNWRALALKDGDAMEWFWIGPHSYYDRLLKQF